MRKIAWKNLTFAAGNVLVSRSQNNELNIMETQAAMHEGESKLQTTGP